jgi:hypothetical protein
MDDADRNRIAEEYRTSVEAGTDLSGPEVLLSRNGAELALSAPHGGRIDRL